MKALAHRLRNRVDPYQPLELREDEIRLVKVLPTAGDVIKCSVWHAQQSSAYTCLSYRCGMTEHGSKLIRGNGKLYNVLINLWDFLDFARRTLSDEALWIDALSINQQDSREKATQVSRMGTIYSNCRHTRIWLGRSHEAQQLYEAPWALTQDMDLVTRLIGNNLYWDRASILREVLLSTQRTLHVGDISIKWALLQSLYNRLSDSFADDEGLSRLEPIEQEFLTSRAAPFLKQLRVGNIKLESQSFRQLLETHKSTRCSLRQDHIFALLPLSARGATFLVDYNASVYEVFFETLRSFNDGQCLCWVRTLEPVLWVYHFLRDGISDVDTRKLMRPILEMRVYADDTLPDDPQARESRSRHRIDLRSTIPFDVELDIELAYHEQVGSQRWRCRCIYAYTQQHYGVGRSAPVKIADGTICSSIEIFQTESTSVSTPFIVRLSQLAFLHLADGAFRLPHLCFHYSWDDDQIVKFCDVTEQTRT